MSLKVIDGSVGSWVGAIRERMFLGREEELCRSMEQEMPRRRRAMSRPCNQVQRVQDTSKNQDKRRSQSTGDLCSLLSMDPLFQLPTSPSFQRRADHPVDRYNPMEVGVSLRASNMSLNTGRWVGPQDYSDHYKGSASSC